MAYSLTRYGIVDMVYFPLLNFNRSFQPSTTIHNFSPNNYQSSGKTRFLYLHHTDGITWHTHYIKTLSPGSSYTVTPNTFPFDIFNLNGTFLSLLSEPLSFPHLSNSLPDSSYHVPDTLPVWRSTVSLTHSTGTFTSYQGEITPFPCNSTFLSFNYLTQPVKAINYLIFMNLESSPSIRSAKLEFYRPDESPTPFYAQDILTNSINSIRLPAFVNSDKLVCIKSENCSGIPLFFSYCPETFTLSLEHTHPPASLAIHGNRFIAQGFLKRHGSTF